MLFQAISDGEHETQRQEGKRKGLGAQEHKRGTSTAPDSARSCSHDTKLPEIHSHIRRLISTFHHARTSLVQGPPLLMGTGAQSLSHVQLFEIPWTVAFQAPLFMGFSRQEYWSGLPFPPAGDLPDPGIKPTSPALAGGFFSTRPPGKPCPS